MTKVYQLRRRYAAYFETVYCGVVVQLVFSASVGNAGELKAELTTSDRFMQDAIEHDPRYGREFYLVEQFGEPDPVPEVKPSDVSEGTELSGEAKAKKSVKKKVVKKEEPAEEKNLVFDNVNEAMRFLLEKGETVTEENLQALLRKYNATIAE